METLLISLGVVGAYVLSSLRVLNQYERGVMFFLGKYTGTKGPGPASSCRRCSRG